MSYQPKTGARCTCKRGIARDNCPTCEGTGMVIDFAAIHARKPKPRVCKGCGKPETIRHVGGAIYTDTAQFLGYCADCINRAWAAIRKEQHGA